MRIISQDNHINISYENSFLCVVEDDNDEDYHVAVRTPSFQGYMPLATYKTEAEAMKVFNDMKIAAQTSLQNFPYQLK